MNRQKQKSERPIGKMRGATLLEVLVSILIFSAGMLAIVGLQANAFKHSGDVQYRAEAIHLVNAFVGEMKAKTTDGDASDAAFQNRFTGGAEFIRFRDELARLPNAFVEEVTFRADTSIPDTSQLVEITVRWQVPGDDAVRRYTQTSVIGNNT